ncbi:hypothetical protein RJT34_10503 [Clitoria ternatea]|uniref:HORMA domain-containing protein n=1 Tax=Clitoria ternatea TaxID=43366 RepID=A0AAN9K8H9_CLITE
MIAWATTGASKYLSPAIESKEEQRMVVAQKVKEAEITEQNSLLLTRNLLRIAIFNISYIRGLFPEKYFNDKSVPALGVYDALQKKYLKTLLFCVCEAVDGPMIEEYAFSFSYSDSEKQEVSMNINRTGNKKQGGAFKCNSTTEITPQQMRSSACKMIRTLVQLMRTLEKMPEELQRSLQELTSVFFRQRTILMKLLYYDDVTPADYEPPFFKGCSDEEAYHPWAKNPLRMEVGNVNSKHFVLALKVKSVLDPCEDDNEGIQDDMSTGDDSMQKNEYYETDSEVDITQGNNQYIVAPIDNTQDPEEDEQQLVRVKEWIKCCHRDTIELTDVLSNFPDISVILTEEIIDKLDKEGVLSKIGKETYAINKDKKFEYEFATVKEEIDGQIPQVSDRGLQVEDPIYMKALYHALPMTHVSVPKLQSLLEGEVNQTAARKIIDKMVRDGFVEPKGNKRLGKRVIHSELTERKFIEVQEALSAIEAMDIDHCEPNSPPKQTALRLNGSNYDGSTCGVLHSIGSDLTRMKVTSETNYTDSRSGQKMTKAKEPGTTPTSKPVASRESFALGKENGIANQGDETDTIICSKSSQDKRPRKASAVYCQGAYPSKCEATEISGSLNLNLDPIIVEDHSFFHSEEGVLKDQQTTTWLLEITSQLQFHSNKVEGYLSIPIPPPWSRSILRAFQVSPHWFISPLPSFIRHYLTLHSFYYSNEQFLTLTKQWQPPRRLIGIIVSGFSFFFREKIEGKNKELKHLGFVRIAAIQTYVIVLNLYEYAKHNSGPLRSAVGTVENTVTTVLGPVCNKFKGVPDDVLVFVDDKVDEATHKFDEHAPPLAKQLANQAKGLIENVAHEAGKVASEVQTGGPRAAIHYVAAESVHFVLVSSVKLWSGLNHYPPFHALAEMAVPTAAHWAEKYNHVIKVMADKGYTLVGYLPLIPIDKIAKAFKQGEANLKGDEPASAEQKSESSSDSD